MTIEIKGKEIGEMNTELDNKAKFLSEGLEASYKECGVESKIRKLLGGKDWMLTVKEIRLAIGENNSPEQVSMKQFEKIALLLGTNEQDARLLAVKAVFQKLAP